MPETDSPPTTRTDVGLASGSPWALPRTAYIWLALIAFAVLMPSLMRLVSGSSNKKEESAALSSTDFEKLVSGEQSARSAFADNSLLRRVSPSNTGDGQENNTGILASAKRHRDKSASEAIIAFRQVAKRGDAPNSARKILLLEHLIGKPFDEVFATGVLRPALVARKVSTAEIDAELRLWRAVLANGKRLSVTEVADNEKRIRAMELAQFQNLALADLYRAAGDTAKAEIYQTALDKAASLQAARATVVGAVMLASICGGLVGTGFFVYFGTKRRWQDIRASEAVREDFLPQLSYGDLLDTALFYLASLFALRLAFGLLAPSLGLTTDRSATEALIAGTAVYVGAAFIAVIYLMAVFKRRGGSWEEIGLRFPGFGGVLREIGYGIAGFSAMLPLILILGALAHVFTKGSPQLTPNPILPLLVAERNVGGRLLIFFLVSVCAPLLEELFFRGVLYTGLRTRYPWAVAALLSGILFAVLHPMADWLPIAGMGFVFALMREHRQSLIPSMTAHFLQNSFAFVSILLSGQ